MNIAFLAPLETQNQHKMHFTNIVNFLIESGHTVVHALSATEETLASWDQEKREEYFNIFYSRIVKSDIVIAECSFPSVHVGYQISYAVQQDKAVIMLKLQNSSNEIITSDRLNLHKKIWIYEYTGETLFTILNEAIECTPTQKYKKYNVLFTTEMVTRLNEISKKKNLPKSVYIRQLLEKGLALEEC